MRDIREKKKKIIVAKKIISRGKFTWELDSHLLSKCQNVINSQKYPRRYTGLSDLIKQGLLVYQAGKLKLIKPRNLNNPKRQVSVRLSPDLKEFYESFPKGQRTELVESVLVNYLGQLVGKQKQAK
ncbi:MAG: hypothetical protein MRERV_12c033 [Mycoplasmataceae bacterium RV_VA103A]|nr:MAG: hypothetical protein MRERV_12c033 [Mycoplasmataceae bacterium RV_VA103A]